MAFFPRPIERRAPRPVAGVAYIRLLDLHGAIAKRSTLFMRPLASAAAVRTRFAQILAADQAAITARDWANVTCQYRHVLELIVDGVTEERWVGQLDVTSMAVNVATAGSTLALAPWTPGPRHDDPAWTEPTETP